MTRKSKREIERSVEEIGGRDEDRRGIVTLEENDNGYLDRCRGEQVGGLDEIDAGLVIVL